jgi:hypothetical protein
MQRVVDKSFSQEKSNSYTASAFVSCPNVSSSCLRKVKAIDEKRIVLLSSDLF